MVIVAIVAAVWLVVAPFLFTFSTAAMWSNIAAAVLIAGLALYADLGPMRFYGVAVIGLYVAVAAFFFGLATLPLWLDVLAGAVAVVAGYLGSREEKRPTVRSSA
jgi:hypothetical protein